MYLSSEQPYEKLLTHFPRSHNRDWQNKMFITFPISAPHQFTLDKSYTGKLVSPSTKTMRLEAFRIDERCSFRNRLWLGSCKIWLRFVKSVLKSEFTFGTQRDFLSVCSWTRQVFLCLSFSMCEIHSSISLSTLITGPDALVYSGTETASVHNCVNSNSALQIAFRHTIAGLGSLPITGLVTCHWTFSLA